MAQWEVVAGADKGGILVRAGRDTKSQELGSRLAFKARVLELELVGDRLHYQRLTGSGPDTGWVSVRLKEKDLLVRLGGKSQSFAEDDDGDLEFLPPTRKAVAQVPLQNVQAPQQVQQPEQLPAPGDRERRENTRQVLLQQMQAMPYLRPQFEAQIAALDEADAQERAAITSSSTPLTTPTAAKPQHSFIASAQAPSLRASESLQNSRKPQHISAASTQAPRPSAAEIPQSSALGRATTMVSRSPEANFEEPMPSIDDLLAKIDSETVEDREPNRPPTIEEMLAMIDKDEQEEMEYESAIADRDAFFELGSLEGTSVSRMAIVDPLAGLSEETISFTNNFSYANVTALGDQFLAQARPHIEAEMRRREAEKESGASSAPAAVQQPASSTVPVTPQREIAAKTAPPVEDSVETSQIRSRISEKEEACGPRTKAALLALKQSELRKRARSVGCDEDSLDRADDEDDTKAALVKLMFDRYEEFQVELLAMKQSDLRKYARQAGCDEAGMDRADDADDTKIALASLIIDQFYTKVT